VIANRTLDRAQELAGEFSDIGPVVAAQFQEVETQRFDLIVNATSASLKGDVPAVPASVVDSMTACYDMAYGSGETAFTAWAKRLGAGTAAQGWGMLVEQAAEAFFQWRGVRPDTRPVLDALRQRATARTNTPA
jgi:shikimate dehydrogenase